MPKPPPIRTQRELQELSELWRKVQPRIEAELSQQQAMTPHAGGDRAAAPAKVREPSRKD